MKGDGNWDPVSPANDLKKIDCDEQRIEKKGSSVDCVQITTGLVIFYLV